MKKLMKLILSLTLVSVLSLAGISQVSALEDGASTRAIETYSRSVDIQLAGDYGYVTATINISHNMTTGKSWITQVSVKEHFNVSYVLLRTEDINTSPTIGTTFQGAIKVKIIYKYVHNNTHYTTNGYIQL